MVIGRFYGKDGRPAYVVLYLVNKDGFKRALRLVYPRAADFSRLWDKAVEAGDLPI